MKRGDKLEKALAADSEQELADMGLRYDLTLPLSRYYAANKELLPSPFKVIQTDRVYRAERPQKGRLREFVQCDIDILGDDSLNAEVELIDVTARALLALGFCDFTLHVNDRRLLRGMLQSMGFAPEALDTVCVSFDKLDKIGPSGVAEELLAKEMPAQAVEKLTAFLQQGDFALERVAALCTDKALADGVRYVVDTAATLSGGRYNVAYTPSLVRGQGYYTGMVFEITCPAFSGAIAGGGRYDNMIGKFLGQRVPAVGFSIGFERICAILLDEGYEIPTQQPRLALLYGAQANFAQVLEQAAALRDQYAVTVLPAAKKVGKQIDRLQATGYTAVCFSEKFPECKQLG
jgi:histidyl-tRNA synthetase